MSVWFQGHLHKHTYINIYVFVYTTEEGEGDLTRRYELASRQVLLRVLQREQSPLLRCHRGHAWVPVRIVYINMC